MNICIYVCIYVYIHIFMYVYVYIYCCMHVYPPPCRRPLGACLILCGCVGGALLDVSRAGSRGWPSTRFFSRVTCLAYVLMYSLTVLLDIVFWCSQTCFGPAWETDFEVQGRSDLLLSFVSA